MLSKTLLAVCLTMTTALLAQTPPAAKRLEHTEVRHGANITDHYYWLREKSNPEVVQYLEAENAYTESATKQLKPFEDALYKEMLGRIKQTDLSVPAKRGAYYYYSRTEEGKQYPLQCRKKGSLDAPEEVILDLNELAKGLKFFSLGAMKISPDENLLAYTSDTTGFRQYRLAVKSLKTGKTLADSAERVTSVEWAADNKTLLFTTEDAVAKRSDQLWRLVLGSKVEGPVYEEKDELYRIFLGKTRDREYLMLTVLSTDTSEVRYTPSSRPAEAMKIFLPRKKDHRYSVDHREGLFYIRTNRDGAKNFQVMTAPVADPSPKNWKVFLAHQPQVLLQGIQLFQTFAVAMEKSEALNTLRVLDFKTGKWQPLTFPRRRSRLRAKLTTRSRPFAALPPSCGPRSWMILGSWPRSSGSCKSSRAAHASPASLPARLLTRNCRPSRARPSSACSKKH